MAYISGQGGQDNTGILSPDFAVQVEQAYANLRAALEGIGATPDQVAKLTILVVDHDMSKLEVLTKSVKEMFAVALPAQTLIPVPKLAVDAMLFEVEAVVIRDQPRHASGLFTEFQCVSRGRLIFTAPFIFPLDLIKPVSY